MLTLAILRTDWGRGASAAILGILAPAWFIWAADAAELGLAEGETRNSRQKADADYDLTAEQGLHHERVVSSVIRTNQAGEILKNPGYVHLEMGLHYQDEEGVLQKSDPVIEPFPDGAVVRRSSTKVIFAPDLNSEGAVDILLEDNIRLRGTPIGLSYYDPVSGQSVLIAEVVSSKAKIVSRTRIIYEDCFDDISADAVYDVSKQGVMQMIVIKENIPHPKEFGLSDESRLEVITEFIDAPVPQQQEILIRTEKDPRRRLNMREPDFKDRALRFGNTLIPHGIAFGMNLPGEVRSVSEPIGKTWQSLPEERRSLLFEAVEHQVVKEAFDALPRKRAHLERKPAHERAIPARRIALARREPVQIAMSDYKPKGVALDYQTVASASSLSFLPGQTYFLTNTITVSSSATLGAGSYLKFGRGATLNVYYLSFAGTAANPTILTAYDDDSYGELLPGSTGQPTGTYAANALKLNGGYYNLTVQRVLFRHAETPVYFGQETLAGEHSILNSTFENCTRMVHLDTTVASLSGIRYCSVSSPFYSLSGYATNPPTFNALTNCADEPYAEVPKSQMVAANSSFWPAAAQPGSLGYDWDASKAIDSSYRQPAWHSATWAAGLTNQWMRLDLGTSRMIGKFRYYPRIDSGGIAPYNGTIYSYHLYVTESSSTNISDWGPPVKSGTWSWDKNNEVKSEVFSPKLGRYVILQGVTGMYDYVAAGELWVYEHTATVMTPVIHPPSGVHPAPITVVMTSGTPMAEIRYTTDGTEPTLSSSLYSGAFSLSQLGNTVIRAKAFKQGMIAVEADPRTYLIRAKPTISVIEDRATNWDVPVTSVFQVGDTETATENLVVTANWDNSALIQNAVIGGSGAMRSVTVTTVPEQIGTAMLTISVTDGDGFIGAETYFLTVSAPNLPTPVFQVSFSDDHSAATNNASVPGVSGASIHYTTNGSDPLNTDPISPPVIYAACIVKARAFKSAWNPSPVASISVGQATAVNFSPDGHDLLQYSTNALSLTMTSGTGGTIRYKAGLSGAWQSVSSGSAIALDGIDSGIGVVEAFSFTSSTLRSPSTARSFSFRLPQPSHAAVYNAVQGHGIITFDTNGGRLIRFTTNSVEPDAASLVYSGPITSSVPVKVYARAQKSGYISSGVVSAWINKLPEPRIATDSGVLTNNIEVSNALEAWLLPNLWSENAYGENRNGSGWVGNALVWEQDVPLTNFIGSRRGQGGAWITATRQSDVSFGRTYTLGGWFKGSGASKTYAGMVNYDALDNQICHEDIGYSGNPGPTYLTDSLATGATTAWVANDNVFKPVDTNSASAFAFNYFVPLSNFVTNGPVVGANQPGLLSDLLQQIGNNTNTPSVTNVSAGRVDFWPPYSGPTLGAGTPVLRRKAGGTHQYQLLANSSLAPDDVWKYYSNTFTYFRAGTERIALFQYMSPNGGVTRETGFEFWEGTMAERPVLAYKLSGTGGLKVSVTNGGPVKLVLDGNHEGNIELRQQGARYIESTVLNRSITFKAAKPEAVVVASGTNVLYTAFCGTANATIRYTIDGTDPTPSSLLYSVGTTGILLPATATVKFRAFKPNYLDSDVLVRLGNPVFTPPGGTYEAGQNVTITPAPEAQLKVLQRGQNLLSVLWEIGTNLVQPNGFTNHGAVVENEVQVRPTPHGTFDKVWVSTNLDSQTGYPYNSDGGWTVKVSITPTNTYRFSVWMRKNDSSPQIPDGYSYLGVGQNQVSALTGTTVDSLVGNPYCWWGRLPPNEWCLVVGYVHPSGHLGTNSYSKVLRMDGSVVASGVDFRWLPTRTSTIMRVFHSYTEEVGNTHEFWDPRVEIVSSTSGHPDVLFAPPETNPKIISLAARGTWQIDAMSSNPNGALSVVRSEVYSVIMPPLEIGNPERIPEPPVGSVKQVKVVLSPVANGLIRYTVDGTEPTTNSHSYPANGLVASAMAVVKFRAFPTNASYSPSPVKISTNQPPGFAFNGSVSEQNQGIETVFFVALPPHGSASISDVDSHTFAKGRIRVEIVNSNAYDRFHYHPWATNFSRVGESLRWNGTNIAIISGGTNGVPLEVAFADEVPRGMEQALHGICYSYTDPTILSGPITRTNRVTVWDGDGGVTVTTRSISVLPGGAFVVDAGTNQTIDISQTTELVGTVNGVIARPEDGLSLFWSKVDGPPDGMALIATPNEEMTTVSFSKAGTYVIRFRAQKGSTNDDDDVTIHVTGTGNILPTVTITSPLHLQTNITEVTNITITATASDVDGNITKVEFFDGPNEASDKIGEDTSAPYSVLWPMQRAGMKSIWARATDNSGGTNSSKPVAFQVETTNQYPAVSIIWPNDGDIFKAWSDIEVMVSALPSNEVNLVQVFAGTNHIGSDTRAPFAIAQKGWRPGVYILKAKASRTNGTKAVSAPVTITVKEEEPTGSGYWDPGFSIVGGDGDSARVHEFALALDPNGALFSGQASENTGAAFRVAKWVNCGWSIPISATEQDIPSYVYAIRWHLGSLYVGGKFGTDYGLREWTGTGFSALGDFSFSNISRPGVRALEVIDGGLFTGGDFVAVQGDNSTASLARLDLPAKVWEPFGLGLNGSVVAISEFRDEIYVGGYFTTAGGDSSVQYLAKWTGTAWLRVGAGVNGPVRTLTVSNGRLFVGGEFTAAGGHGNANCIAVWDGANWSTIGHGVSDGTPDLLPVWPYEVPTSIDAIAARGNEVYVTGDFTKVWNGASSINANYVARAYWSEDAKVWTWTALGSGLSLDIWDNFTNRIHGRAIVIREHAGPGYDVIVGGGFNRAGGTISYDLARWIVGSSDCTNASGLSVLISSPTDGAVSGTNVTFAASASVGTDWIDLYVNGALLTSASSLPLNYSADLSPGSYTAVAVARDDSGTNSAASAPVHFTVRLPTGPTAVAETNYVLSTGATTNLNVLANDVSSGGTLSRALKNAAISRNRGKRGLAFVARQGLGLRKVQCFELFR